MSYVFRIDTILYNALYAAQDYTRVLSDTDIHKFKSIICELAPKAAELYNQLPQRVIFNADDNGFFENERKNITRFREWIILHGPRLELDRIKRINIILGSDVKLCIMVSARKKFKEYLFNRDKGPTKEQEELLTNIA